MNYGENYGMDNQDQAAAQGEFESGLLAEGYYDVRARSGIVALGFPNGKPRVSWMVDLYQNGEKVGSQAVYQGIDPNQPAAMNVTFSMLAACGATNAREDLASAIKAGLDEAELRGMGPETEAQGKIAHEQYQGKWQARLSIFGGNTSFKDKIPGGARHALAAALLGAGGPPARGQAQRPPGKRPPV